MAVVSPLSATKTVTAMLALTAVTGLVDAVSYLRLGRVFVANMTGNVVFLGLSVYPHSGLQAGASRLRLARSSRAPSARAGSRLGSRTRPSVVARSFRHRSDDSRGRGDPYGYWCSWLRGRCSLLDHRDLRGGTWFPQWHGPSLRRGRPDDDGAHDGSHGLSADSVYAGGPGAKPTRRIGSVLAMLVGALVGATLLRWSASAAIGLAALVVALVAASFALAEREVRENSRSGVRSDPSFSSHVPVRSSQTHLEHFILVCVAPHPDRALGMVLMNRRKCL